MANTKVTSNVISDDINLGGNPTTTTQSAGNNTTRIATTAFVKAAIDATIDSAPGALDTLNELAAAIGDDANFSTTITNSIATKAPLSTPTFTNTVTINSGHLNLDVGMSLQWGDTHERIEQSDGHLEFFVNNGETMTLDTTGLGIGIVQAEGKLHVHKGDSGSSYTADGADAFIIENSDSVAIDIRTPSSNQGLILWSDADARAVALIGYDHSTNDMRFSLNGNNEVLRLADTKEVGIGTGATIDGQLHVKGTTNKLIKLDGTFSSGSYTAMAFARQGTDKWRVFQKSDDAYLSFYNDQASKHQLTLTDDNKVSINNLLDGGNADSLHSAPLNVTLRSSSTGNVLTLNYEHLSASAGLEQRIQFNAGDDGTAETYANAGYIASGKENVYVTDDTRDSYMSFATAVDGTQHERMRIKSGGQIGIGTTSPGSTALLHVNGGIRFDTNPWADGTAMNVVSSNVYTNMNTFNAITNIYYKMGIIDIYHTDGHSQVLFVANGGSGVGFQFSMLRPDTSTVYNNTGVDFTVDTQGDGNESFRIQVTSGGGALSISHTAGTSNSSWGVFVSVLMA